MASFAYDASARYPAGTTLEVYGQTLFAQAPDGSPRGTAVTSETVGEDSQVLFAGLEVNTDYLMYGLVDGRHVWTRFKTGPPVPDTAEFQDQIDGLQLAIDDASTSAGSATSAAAEATAAASAAAAAAVQATDTANAASALAASATTAATNAQTAAAQALAHTFPTAIDPLDAANNSLYRSSADNKLYYRDNAGADHALY